MKGERGFVGKCCRSSSTPSISSAEDQRVVSMVGKVESGKGLFGCLVDEYGWKVRRLVEEDGEMRKVAQVQAQAFHVPMVLFNDLFFEFFQVFFFFLFFSFLFPLFCTMFLYFHLSSCFWNFLSWKIKAEVLSGLLYKLRNSAPDR